MVFRSDCADDLAVSLPDFIRDHMEDLLLQWEAFAQTLLPSVDRVGLRDDAENLLKAIAADMETPQSADQQRLKSEDSRVRELTALPRPADVHASARHEIGFDIDQLVAEYRVLRASVIRLWMEKVGPLDLPALEELTRFNEAIDEAVAESVARYSATAERAKDLFLAVLGHDLRTPLSAVLAAANILLRSESEDTGTVKAAALILRSSTRMTQMISDLVDFTRTRLGNGLPLVRVPMDLGLVAQQVIEEIEAAHPKCTVRGIFVAVGTMHA
jgi:signal transduction histidine kinase